MKATMKATKTLNQEKADVKYICHLYEKNQEDTQTPKRWQEAVYWNRVLMRKPALMTIKELRVEVWRNTARGSAGE